MTIEDVVNQVGEFLVSVVIVWGTCELMNMYSATAAFWWFVGSLGFWCSLNAWWLSYAPTLEDDSSLQMVTLGAEWELYQKGKL